MKRLIVFLSLSLSLMLIAGCGDAPETKQSSESEAVTEAVGGPFTADEFDRFLETIPEITKLTNPTLNPNMNGGKQVSPEEVTAKVMEAARSMGWTEERFMYVYGQAMAVMNLDQLSRMQAQLGEQMQGMTEEQKATMEQMMGSNMDDRMAEVAQKVDEQVPVSEQKIIRDNMDELYRALGIRQ